MSSEENEKYHSMYKNIFKDISEKFGLRKASENFKKIQLRYLKSLDNFFHSKCSKEFQWIESHSVMKDDQLQKDDSTSEREFEKKTNELNRCIKKHDKGYTDVIVDFEKEFNDFNTEIAKNVSKCYELKTEAEVKECIKDKLMVGTPKLISIFDKYSQIFAENENQLKL